MYSQHQLQLQPHVFLVDISIIKGEYKGQKIVVRSLEHSLKTEQQFLIKAAIMT